MMNFYYAFLIQGDSKIPNLSLINVAIAFLFLCINGAISIYLGLKLEKSLLTSSLRCFVQLTLMGKILENIFHARNPYLVMLMTLLLIFSSTLETVYNKTKGTFQYMFPSVFFSTLFSVTCIGILGTRFAMNEKNFWVPELFIPTIGLLLGVVSGAMAVGLTCCLTTLGHHANHIETYLSFGATRWEAGQQVAIEAIRVAMLPTISSMSVVGLITIPGVMTGQILGGSSILNAVYYQQIITFMISATTGLSVVSIVYFCIHHLIDGQHRLRPDRMITSKPSLFKDIQCIFREK